MINAAVNLLKSEPCLDCGMRYPYYCMDFDHRDGTVKKGGVKVLKGRSMTAIMGEIAKCDLVCANCHRLRSVRRIEASSETYYSRVVKRCRHRELLISEKSKPCLDCSGSFHPASMDFDHVRDVKVKALSRLLTNFGREKLLAEIAKCDVVCANCHRKRTYSRIVEAAA